MPRGLRPHHRQIGDVAIGDPIFEPCSTQPSPSRRAVVRMLAGSEPPCGSSGRSSRSPRRAPCAAATAALLLAAIGVDRIHAQARLHRHETAQCAVAALQFAAYQPIADRAQPAQHSRQAYADTPVPPAPAAARAQTGALEAFADDRQHALIDRRATASRTSRSSPQLAVEPQESSAFSWARARMWAGAPPAPVPVRRSGFGPGCSHALMETAPVHLESAHDAPSAQMSGYRMRHGGLAGALGGCRVVGRCSAAGGFALLALRAAGRPGPCRRQRCRYRGAGRAAGSPARRRAVAAFAAARALPATAAC